MLGFALDDGDDQAGSGTASSLDDEFGGFAVEAAIAEATGGAASSKTQKPASSISQHALDVVLPDMTLPPKTNRSLLFRGDDATPVLPLFTGMREGDNAGDDTTAQDLTWLRKYAGTKSFAPIGSGLGADSLRASSSRRSGGGRMAAQQASAYITALASSDQRSNNDDNFAVPDRAQFFNAKSPQVTDARVSGFSSVGGVQASVNRSSVMEVDEALLAPPSYSYADHGVRSHWRCMGCGCSPFYTSEVLEGPLGAKSLCLACGTAWISEGRSETLSRQAYDSNYLSGEQGEEISAAVVLRHTINNGRVYPLANALLPESLSTHRQRLHERFPNDYFDLVQVGNGPLRLGVSGHGPAATRGNCRVMCFDCDSRGKVYALGRRRRMVQCFLKGLVLKRISLSLPPFDVRTGRDYG